MIHIVAQPYLQPGDGPIVLIVVPTRELALQVEYFIVWAAAFWKCHNTHTHDAS